MKNILNIVLLISKKTLIVLLKLFFCLCFTILVGYGVALIGTIGYVDTKHLDWQIAFYVSLGLFLILGAWINSFLRTLTKIKVSFIILFLIWFFSPYFLNSVMNAINEDTCVDIGICAEGLKFSNGIMNKEYCLKEGQKWDDKEKVCDMRIEMRTCEKQGYKWIYTEDKCSHKIIKNW